MGDPGASRAVDLEAAGSPLEPLLAVHGPHRRLWAFIKSEGGNLWVIGVYAVGVGALTLAVPLAVQALVNTIAFETLLQPVLALSVLLLLALGFQGVMHAVQTYLVELVQQRLFVHVAADLAYRLPRVRREAFDGAHGPELVNRFFSVFTAQKAAGILLIDGLAVALQTLIGLLLLAWYHPLLLAFDALLVAGLAFVLTVLGRGATRTTLAESKSKYAMAAWLEEVARQPGTFRSTPAALFALERTDALAGQYLVNRRAHFRVLFRQLVGLLVTQAVASAALLGVGGWLIVQRQLTLGQLVAAEFVVAAVVAGFVKLFKHIEAYFDMIAAVDKLGRLIELPLERPGGAELPAGGPAALALKDVAGAHLAAASLVVPAGGRVGILGADDARASALLDLMGGLREPVGGAVEIGGYDLRDLSLGELRERVWLLRSAEIVAGSVVDNVRLGRAEVGLDAARGALEAVGVWDAVQALPEGLQSVLATGGHPLSAREAGRVVLARALVARPRLMLVDEALDGLEDATRDRALDAFFAPAAPWTLVAVSRDPAVLARCERVYGLEGGRLVERPGASPERGARP